MPKSNKYRKAIGEAVRPRDLKQLKEVLKTIEELRREGYAGPGYNLVSPYARRPGRIGDDTEADPVPVRKRRR